MTAVKIPLSPGAAVPRDLREWSSWATNAAAQNVRAGATGYNTGVGIWFGRDTDGVNKLFIGDASGNKMTWDGTTLSVVGNITLQDGAVGEDELADGAVTEDKIGDAAVSEGKLTANAVTAGKISAGAVTTDKLDALAVTSAKIAADAVTADKIDVTDLSAVSANIQGPLSIGTSGSVGSGQTAYNTGTGFWLEYNGGSPRFSIGNASGHKLLFDTSSGTLTLVGDISANNVLTMVNAPTEASADKTVNKIVLKGDSNTNAAVGAKLGSSVGTTNSGSGGTEWQALRTFVTDFTGTFRLMVEVAKVNTLGSPPTNGQWRVKNGAGSVQSTAGTAGTSYTQTFSGELSVTAPGETWTIEGLSETDLSTYIVDTNIRDIEVRARFNHATIT